MTDIRRSHVSIYDTDNNTALSTYCYYSKKPHPPSLHKRKKMATVNPHQQAMRNLLGQTLKCTLADGRTATGTLICIDRLYVVTHVFCCCKTYLLLTQDYVMFRKNLILSHVVEERTVDSAVYSGSTGGKIIRTKRVLVQAMIPGIQLVKVELAQSVYEQYVQPVLQSTP